MLVLILSTLLCLVSAKTLPYKHSNSSRIFLEGSEDLGFIAIGDWGSRKDHQHDVAQAMGEWCSKESIKCDFIISTGDNIYSDGVTSVSDHHFDDTWKDVYTYQGIGDLPWYLTVGNHDHHSHNGEWHQVEYSLVNDRWNMPSLAFAFEFATKSTSVKFVSVDTISIHDDINDADSMLSLLDSELQSADSDSWKIVFSHFPVHSGGHYPGSHTIRRKVLPILKDNDVDFYLTGHDHNQQHWVEKDHPTRLEHITAGAGGQTIYHQHDDTTQENLDLGMELKHFFAGYGFTHWSVTQDHIHVRFVDIDGDVAYDSVRRK